MKNFLLSCFSILSLLALYGCTDKEPAVEQKPKEVIFQGQIDALEKAKKVDQVIKARSAQQREAIDEQSQ
jgi:hypothetical protein